MNNYYRYENEDKVLFIKFSKTFPNIDRYSVPVRVIIRFDKGDGHKYYHVPNRLFNNKKEIIKYFKENQSSPWLKVKVIDVSETL